MHNRRTRQNQYEGINTVCDLIFFCLIPLVFHVRAMFSIKNTSSIRESGWQQAQNPRINTQRGIFPEMT